MKATLADDFDEFEPASVRPPAPKPKCKTLAQKPRPERTDIHLWLSKNSPRNVLELLGHQIHPLPSLQPFRIQGERKAR